MTFRHLVACGGGALLFAVAPLAFAHAYPTHRSPDAGSTVALSTTTVSIDFDEGLEPALSSIQVTNAAGRPMTRGHASVSGADNKRMRVDLAALKPGVYTVNWAAVATDGHRTHGAYTFTAESPPPRL